MNLRKTNSTTQAGGAFISPVCNVPDDAAMLVVIALITVADLDRWLAIRFPGDFIGQKRAAEAWSKLCYSFWRHPQNYLLN